MESVLLCDTFGSFDNFQRNDACFSSILEDLQDRSQLDFGFNFSSEPLEFTETNTTSTSSAPSVPAPRRTPKIGEKRKTESLENFWDSEYFLSSNDCNFVSTYSTPDDFSYPATSENFENYNVKLKNLENSFGLDQSAAELCTANHVHKKQKVEGPIVSPLPNVSSPPFSQRSPTSSSPVSPQKTPKRRLREVTRRSTPIPILCPDPSLPPNDPVLLPNIFEFKKTISDLDDTSRTVYRDTLLQLARNAESGIFEPSNHNNGMNFESLLMRMMFSFSVPSISPSFFAASNPTAVDRSHLMANHPNYYNNLQFVPIISSRSPSSVQPFRHDGKVLGETSPLPHHPHAARADPFFQKTAPYSVPNFSLVKPFPIPISSTSNTYRAPSDNSKQPVMSRHLPIRVL